MTVPFEKNIDEFEKNGIAVSVESYDNGILKLIINTGAVPQNMFKNAIIALKNALK